MDEREEQVKNEKLGFSGTTWVQMANRNTAAEQPDARFLEKNRVEVPSFYQNSSEYDEEDWEEERERIARERRRRLYLARKRKKRQQKKILICSVVVLVSLLVSWLAIHTVFSAVDAAKEKEKDAAKLTSTPSPVITSAVTKEPEQPTVTVEPFEIAVQEELLTPNEYSRPELEMGTVTGVVIHYVGNPGTEGISNRNFFESLKDNHETSVSSHFVIGLQGEIIQCVPLDEVAYANRGRNFDTISIECCHPDEEGKFNDATYEALVQLAAYLLNTYDLGEEGILRHYEVTGKICPRYYVNNPEAWETLKADIMKEAEEHPVSVLVME